MDYELSYLPLALKDLEDIFRYIVDNLEAPQTAQNLLIEIDNAVHHLIRFPNAHTLYRSGKPLKKEYRKITVKHYYVFYVVEENRIEIHRIIHSKRDIDSVLE